MTKKNAAVKSKDFQYAKAPILEAICDFTIVPANDSKIPNRSKFNSILESNYEGGQEITLQNFKLRADRDNSHLSSSNEKMGYSFLSKDKKYIVQIKKNGFTFSQNQPYENWKKFITEAKRVWELYAKEIKPQKVERVALRYINRIDISEADEVELSNYFETYPRVLKDNKAAISNFFMQVQIPQKEGGLAIVNQAVTNPAEIGKISIILDIDVFEFKDFEPSSPSLWKRVDILRKQKNAIFEDSLTDKAKRIFS